MAERDNIERAARSLDTRKRLKLFVLQYLFDRAQTIRALRMTGRRQVVEARGMAKKESRHRLDLNARRPLRKYLARFCVQADTAWRRVSVWNEEIDLQ